MSALFHNPATPVVPFTAPPRRGIRVMNATNVSPSSATVQNAALIADITAAPSAPTQGVPLVAIPQRYEGLPENEIHPIAASSLLNTDYMRQVDPTYRGIKLDSEPSRIVQNSPENMARLNRVLDRTETDPYTGKQVDYYRELPPDENKDYRLPRETMNDVNRRLIAIQGYDHTKPKAQRTERLADAPQPDGRFNDASNYMRIVGEMQERVARDLVNNQKGERPAWMRETQRAFGYNGYQDMNRFVPDLPPTLRADTENLEPTAGQVNNPNPNNELLVRGAYREDAKTAHTGQVDWRNHGKSVDTDARVFTSGMEQRVQDGTYRGEQEHQGFQPGPASLDFKMPQFGEAHETRRKGMPATDFALRATSTLTPVGASDAMANRVLTKILDSVGRQNAGERDISSFASAKSGIQKAPMLNSATAATDGSSTIRQEYPTNQFYNYATAVTSNISLPPVILGTTDDHQEPKRLDFPEKQYRTFASAGAHDSDRGVVISTTTDLAEKKRTDQMNVVGLKMAPNDSPFAEPAWISKESDKQDTKRVFVKTEFFEPGALNFMGPKIKDGVFDQAYKKMEDYSKDAGSRRNAASSTDLGSLQIGKQEIMQGTGKRALTGNISATSYLHGGGDGMAFRTPGVYNRESFMPEHNNNRTQIQDFTALRQAANRITQPI